MQLYSEIDRTSEKYEVLKQVMFLNSLNSLNTNVNDALLQIYVICLDSL